MKKSLITLSLVLISFLSYSQNYFNLDNIKPISNKDRMNNNYKKLALFTAHIILDASGDAFNDEGYKTLGHTLNALAIADLLSIPFLTNTKKEDFIPEIAGYILLRIGMFDPTYNITRGLDFNYVGNSSISDKLIKKLKSPNGIGYLGRIVPTCIGVSLILRL